VVIARLHVESTAVKTIYVKVFSAPEGSVMATEKQLLANKQNAKKEYRAKKSSGKKSDAL
jgi:hypothetical protein